MKKLIAFIASILFICNVSLAQESYTIKMTMKIEGLPPEYASMGEQDIVNYLKGDKYKNEMTSMMGTNTTSFDGKTMTSISDQMGNKSGFTASKAELDSMNKLNGAESKPKIEYTQEKKSIAGYECSKAILTTIGKDGKEQKITVWVTEKIKNTAARGKRTGGRGMSMDFGDLNGYPLQIEMTQNQNGGEMKIIMAAVEVSTAVIDDALFTVNTEGYTMMSYKEMQEKMKNMKRGGQ